MEKEAFAGIGARLGQVMKRIPFGRLGMMGRQNLGSISHLGLQAGEGMPAWSNRLPAKDWSALHSQLSGIGAADRIPNAFMNEVSRPSRVGMTSQMPGSYFEGGMGKGASRKAFEKEVWDIAVACGSGTNKRAFASGLGRAIGGAAKAFERAPGAAGNFLKAAPKAMFNAGFRRPMVNLQRGMRWGQGNAPAGGLLSGRGVAMGEKAMGEAIPSSEWPGGGPTAPLPPRRLSSMQGTPSAGMFVGGGNEPMFLGGNATHGLGERAMNAGLRGPTRIPSNPNWTSNTVGGGGRGAGGMPSGGGPTPPGGAPAGAAGGAAGGPAAPGGAGPAGGGGIMDRVRGWMGGIDPKSMGGRALFGNAGMSVADPATRATMGLGRAGIAGAGIGAMGINLGINESIAEQRRDRIRQMSRWQLGLGGLMGGPEGVIQQLHL